MQPAPALERMVVSEMGEQWSPKTEPAKVAERQTVMISGLIACATGTTIGIKIPKVPQAVPVEKLKKPATIKMNAGRKPAVAPPSASNRVFTNSGVCRRLRQTPLIVHASTKIIFAGSMALIPSVAPSIKECSVKRPRGTKRKNATVKAPKLPQTKEGAAEQFPKAAPRVVVGGVVAEIPAAV